MGLQCSLLHGVDLDQIDKMAPRRVKSAPGPIEMNQHFGAKTDLLDLECIQWNPAIKKTPLFINSEKHLKAQQNYSKICGNEPCYDE